MSDGRFWTKGRGLDSHHRQVKQLFSLPAVDTAATSVIVQPFPQGQYLHYTTFGPKTVACNLLTI
jgi:hypothetical protein